ncbi:MAG: 3-isopropylmalate dehydratase small subunit [Gammaproteobacteria bacterium]|nr:3-isopropylmalate dehydratase small subunit [Gammaproteobacteria bacterium]
MKSFKRVTGIVAPLDRLNVDTDQIIPKQFLKSIERTGFGDNLFDAWRFGDEGAIGKTPNERRINPDFVLNQPRYQDAGILLTRGNFGCGSSREHAVWSLLEFGFRCVIAPSFADIFLSNCFKNGLLPIVLKEKTIDRLFEMIDATPGFEISVDLPAQEVRLPDGERFEFAIDPFKKRTLLEGLDDIGLTMDHREEIAAFEAKHRKRMPWVFTS